MADVEKYTEIIRLLNGNKQRTAMRYMHDNLNGTELFELSQFASRLTALADTVSSQKHRERENRRRGGGASGTQGKDFIQV